LQQNAGSARRTKHQNQWKKQLTFDRYLITKVRVLTASQMSGKRAPVFLFSSFWRSLRESGFCKHNEDIQATISLSPALKALNTEDVVASAIIL